MDSLTIDRIAMVHAHIVEAVIKTSPGSTVSREEQQRLLAQSCAEACALLADWHDEDWWWDHRRPKTDGPLAEVIPGQEHYARFLDPMFKDMLKRVRGHGIDVPDSDVDDARRDVVATVRRYPRMKRGELFGIARDRVGKLREEVCSLAQSLASGMPLDPARQRRARTVLNNVRKVLATLALTLAGAMLGAGPHLMAQNVSGWSHDAANVVMIHHIAHGAQPHLRIAPPAAGPRPH